MKTIEFTYKLTHFDLLVQLYYTLQESQEFLLVYFLNLILNYQQYLESNGSFLKI